MGSVTEHSGAIGDQPAFWLQAEGAGAAPVVYLHGVPTCSEDWRDFLTSTGGLAPDLPGFGRAGKSGAAAYTMGFYDDWLERFLDDRDVGAFRLVVHDWGAVGLLTAQRLADRVERLVVLNAVPLLPGYSWHRTARLWRTPVVGEIAMGLTIAPVLRRALPAPIAAHCTPHFDLGTQRAILRLYRSAPPDALAAAGRGLADLDCPALVVWGEEDPYIDASFAPAYAQALGGDVQTQLVPEAGHWPWVQRPDLVERVAAFLDA